MEYKTVEIEALLGVSMSRKFCGRPRMNCAYCCISALRS
jgi:hypothetical protein